MKKILLIVVPLLLVGGGVVGAGMMGIVKIPGLTPEKKKAAATAAYTEQEEPVAVAKKEPPKEEPPKPVAQPEPVLDMDQGRKNLAKLWNELEPAKIVEISTKWKDEDLAQQMQFLETSKAAEVLNLLEAGRASKISLILQELGAKVEPEQQS